MGASRIEVMVDGRWKVEGGRRWEAARAGSARFYRQRRGGAKRSEVKWDNAVW